MNYLEIVGTFVGLIYLWLEYRASVYLWIASIIMPLIYVFVYYDAGLYADLGINIYYILASVYGLLCWQFKKTKKQDSTNELAITHTPKQLYPQLFITSVILIVAIALLLREFTDSTVPWTDSFTTALSVVAMWMLAKKYVEQWLVWIIVDVVCCVLYVYKGLYFTSGLYAIYTLIAYFGYIKWKQLINVQSC